MALLHMDHIGHMSPAIYRSFRTPNPAKNTREGGCYVAHVDQVSPPVASMLHVRRCRLRISPPTGRPFHSRKVAPTSEQRT